MRGFLTERLLESQVRMNVDPKTGSDEQVDKCFQSYLSLFSLLLHICHGLHGLHKVVSLKDQKANFSMCK